MQELTERIALVTGAGRGIGRAIALALAKAGASVVAAARSEEELNNVVSEIVTGGGKAAMCTVDFSQRSQTLRLCEQAAEWFGPIDVLVNNAGIGSASDPRPFVEYRDEFWDLTMEINLNAPYILSKSVLPHMLEQQWGPHRDDCIGQQSPGWLPWQRVYTASKHGVLGLMRAIATEVSSQGVDGKLYLSRS